MAHYDGPERRDGDSLLGHIDDMLRAQSAHFDARLDSHRAHFDERLTAIEKRVEPMHEVFTTGKVGARIVTWGIGALVGLGTLWTLGKDWIIAMVKEGGR